eukprot:gene848-12801_t
MSSLLDRGAALSMKPLPVLDTSGSVLPSRRGQQEWGAALGNLEDAKVAAEALKVLVYDAVFLDGDAYNGAADISALKHQIQLQNGQIRSLQHDIVAINSEIEKKDNDLLALQRQRKQDQYEIEQLRQDVTNNTEVASLHSLELVKRNEEIERLKAIISGLQ